MPYKDVEKRRKAVHESDKKNMEERFTIRIPAGKGISDAMRIDMQNNDFSSKSAYVLNILVDHLKSIGLLDIE